MGRRARRAGCSGPHRILIFFALSFLCRTACTAAAQIERSLHWGLERHALHGMASAWRVDFELARHSSSAPSLWALSRWLCSVEL